MQTFVFNDIGLIYLKIILINQKNFVKTLVNILELINHIPKWFIILEIIWELQEIVKIIYYLYLYIYIQYFIFI